MPKVSALMPVYNTNLAYLKETIESVLNQTFTDFEFLILNDSPQNLELENFILEYAKQDKRIKYFKNPRNLGISPSRNKLIDLSQGEFLAVIDHDDISVKERFEKEVAFLEANEEVGVVGGYCKDMATNKIWKFPTQDADIKVALMAYNAISHASSMIRKSILDKHNIRYNAFYSPCEDFKLCCDLINFTEFANIDEVLIDYRTFDNTTQTQSQKMKEKDLAILKANSREYPQLFEIEWEWLKEGNDMLKSKRKERTIKITLFGIIFLTIIQKKNLTKIKLFNKIQIFKMQNNL